MTFSIVGRSADGKAFGVAVASKFLGVGAAVPAALADVGAVATQSYANLAYRPQALALLGTGVTAAGTVAALVAGDSGPVGHRQVGVLGAAGDGATYTGDECHPWAGGAAGEGFAIQGNMLAGPAVVGDMRDTWLSVAQEPRLAYRLLAALRAGDLAGGDRRGRQSAALLVVAKGLGYGGTSDVLVDLRVDDHTDPVAELSRLLDLHKLYFERPDPATLIPLTGELAEEVSTLLAARGHAVPDLSARSLTSADLPVPSNADPDPSAHGNAVSPAPFTPGSAGLDFVAPGSADLDPSAHGNAVSPDTSAPGHTASADLDAALASWAGIENLEERLVAGAIDPLVLEILRKS